MCNAAHITAVHGVDFASVYFAGKNSSAASGRSLELEMVTVVAVILDSHIIMFTRSVRKILARSNPRPTRRWYGDTQSHDAATPSEVKKLGVIGAGQMVSPHLGLEAQFDHIV